MTTLVRVLLVRHGESTWNAEGRWQGQADPPLSALGEVQAQHAAAALDAPDLVASSDLVRARATAEALAGAHDRHPVVVDAGLRERDAGAFSGLTRAEIHVRHPGLLADDPARPAGAADGLIPPPGWEPDDVLAARAGAALDRLADAVAERGGDTVVAVTHSGLIYALERPYGGPRLRIANLEGRWFHREAGRWQRGERQLLLDPRVDLVTRPDQL